MPDWHIEFVVTGKNLSDAQAMVHGLKGVSQIGVRPVKEHTEMVRRKPANGVSITDVIADYLKRRPEGANAASVLGALQAHGIKTDHKKTNSNLGNMTRRGLLRRVRPGFYALKKGAK